MGMSKFDGALSGAEKLNNLKLIKKIILKELKGVIGIMINNMSMKYGYHIDYKIEINIIPNSKK